MDFGSLKVQLARQLGVEDTLELDPPDSACFLRVRRYRPEEIAAWQEEAGLFLCPLDQLISRARDSFDTPEDWLGKRLVTIGEDRLDQEMIVMRLRDGIGDQVAPIWHESIGEDWIDVADELGDWSSFADYPVRVAAEREVAR